ALGAILFEMLSFLPLHPGRDSAERLRSTLDGIEAHPARRFPSIEVPPELSALCVQATALQPADRLPSARALHEAVERFLAGDRDLALRSSLARAHAAQAAERAAQALRGESGEERERSAAMAEVGRALALDPRNPEASRIFVELLTQPPRIVPVE